MKESKKILAIYLPLLFIAAIASAVLRTVAVFSDLDVHTGLFNDKLLITISDWITVAMSLIFFIYIFIRASKPNPAATFSGAATYISGGAVSAALIFMSAYMLFYSRVRYGSLLTAFKTTSGADRIILALMLLCAVFALLCALNFFYTSFIAKRESTTRAAFGMLAAIFLALYAAYLYFDTKLPINAPAKVTDQMAFLFSALFFIYETRISLGRALWRPYISFGLIAALLNAYSSIPALILYIVRGDMISDSAAGIVLTFTLFIFITARLIVLSVLPDEEKCPTVSIITEMAKKREAQIAARDDEYARAYEEINKVENDDHEGENYEMEIPEMILTPIEGEETETAEDIEE